MIDKTQIACIRRDAASGAANGFASPVAWRWEHGSDFHRPKLLAGGVPSRHPWDGPSRYFSAGRDALRSLLDHGRRQFGWQRVWIPAYLCLQVVETLLRSGLQCMSYPDGPEDGRRARLNMDVHRGDALLLVNFFGLRATPLLCETDRSKVAVIEDHTHDPWSPWAWESDADYAVASLRKTLPLADGAVLWSPRGQSLPPPAPLSPATCRAVESKCVGMALKAQYLQGDDISKDHYRPLLLAGEEGLGKGEPSGMSRNSIEALADLPVAAWRETRRSNHAHGVERLGRVSGLRVLEGHAPGRCPFSLVIVFDTPARREFIRERLIGQRIFPAVLWPLKDACWASLPVKHRDFSHRMLSLHCDMRYGWADMERVAAAVVEATQEFDDAAPPGLSGGQASPIKRDFPSEEMTHVRGHAV